MASWLPFSLPSTIQKRFLSYALSRIGIFDDASLDLDKLNLTWGRQNVVELNDVAIDIAAISSKANLTPNLQILSGKVTTVRLMVPADIHKSGIVIDAIGVGVSVRYEQEQTKAAGTGDGGGHSQRKPVRRTSSPLATRRSRSRRPDAGNDDALPTVQDLARSFLLDEPAAERRQLEASVAAHTASLEDSMTSESSQGTEPGTGAALGVPAFLASFLTGILDRIVVNITDVKITIETSFQSSLSTPIKVDMLLSVPEAQIWSTTRTPAVDQTALAPTRHLKISSISLGIVEDIKLPTADSVPSLSLAASIYSQQNQASTQLQHPTVALPLSLSQSVASITESELSPISDQTADTDRFADAHDEQSARNITDSQYGIHAGDDNISWGSRQTDGGHIAQNLWESVADEDDLPDSLLLGDEEQASQRQSAPVSSIPRLSQPALEQWPALDPHIMSTSQYSLPGSVQSMVSAAEHVGPSSARHANEQSVPLQDSETLPSREECDDQLAQSRIFTHDEAESMYMSAMAQDSDSEVSQPSIAVPGAWGQDSQVTTPWLARPDTKEVPEAVSEAATPRAQTPVPDKQAEQTPPRAVKTLLTITGIEVSLTLDDLATAPTQAKSSTSMEPRLNTFSTASLARSIPRQESSLSTLSHIIQDGETSSKNAPSHSLSIAVDRFSIQLDLASVQLLSRVAILSQRVMASSNKSRTSPEQDIVERHDFDISIAIHDTHLSMMDKIGEDVSPAKPSLNLVHINLVDTTLRQQLGTFSVQVSQLYLSFMDTQIVGFTQDQADTQTRQRDIYITYSQTQTDTKGRPVPELNVQGQVLQVSIDVLALSQLFEHFGGLNTILESGNALFSSSAPASPTSKRPSGGVRFQDDVLAEPAKVSIKTNIRLAGAAIALQGHDCSVVMRTSVLRAVQREHGFSLSTARLEVDDGIVDSNDIPNQLAADGLRLDFVNSPNDKDLERFLALLTPSKDKYDNDDDILIETLLRQRRKGACLRVTIDAVTAKVSSYEALSRLSTLSDDLSQLAVVTKYLPEDDRPGLLSMIRLKDFSATSPTTPLFGGVKVLFRDLQCAHVGLPLLIAVGLSDLQIEREDGTPLVHQLLPSTGAEGLPMLMARMLGDEVEPLVKIKLYNICVEYSVPVLLDILGKDAAVDPEHAINDLAISLADLATSSFTSPMPRSPASTTKKKTKLDLLLHSSAIGLTPSQGCSKALFVLTDARLSMSVPPGKSIIVLFEMRRAAMFITDDAGRDAKDQLIRARTSSNASTDARVSTALLQYGYASIMSIMSASIRVLVIQASENIPSTTEVDIRNELMLMETCADSTQTLFATLAALAPPGKPSMEPQYLQEPVTLEDMISSFTGEAVTAPQPSTDTLFDAEDDLTSELGLALQTSQVSGVAADDLLLQSEMAESLYGPVSGLIDGMDDDFEDDRPANEAAESLLEEDPFVMTVTPDDLPFSDPTLMKDLREQQHHSHPPGELSIDLLQIEDLGFDALGPETHVLGARNKFAAPTPTALPTISPSQHCPVKVRLRDVHFIWNLHDGYDWQKTREGITTAVERVEQRAEERMANRRHSRHDPDEDESVIGDFLFNSIYIGVPSTQEAQDIRRQINRHIDDLASETESIPVSGISRPTIYSASGMASARPRRRLKLERSRSHKVAFELRGLCLDFLLCASDSPEVQSSIDVRVKSFEIFDNVPTSTWKKFLTLLQTDGGQEVAKPMVHLELLNVRTIQDYAATEMIVKASLLPLRLHVDQDALDFITRFFEFKDDTKSGPSEPADQPFLQRVEVNTVDLQLDYKPKKVDYAGIRSGHTTEFMNFIVLDAANIRLKHAIVYGIKGFEPLHKTLNDVWMPDVRRNQLPTVLAGLAPVRSLVNITSGVRDVVAIPIREYQKDGRLVRSIQKGAYHFGKTTASELARLGAKVAIGTQNILSGAEELLAPANAAGRPSPSHRVSSDYGWHEVEEEDGDREKRAISAYSDQPLGVLAGLRSARRYLEHDLLTAKDAFIAVQGEVMNSASPGAAAVAVARHAPTVILRPVIGATRAVGTTLLGVGNQIDRDNLRKMEDKYKRR